MPVIPGVLETFEKLGKLHIIKNDDYSGDRGPFFNFNCAEYISSWFSNAKDKVYAVMIGIKLARLAILLSSSKAPNNESIEDSFDDAIVYMTIWKADYVGRKDARRNSMPNMQSQDGITNQY